MEEDIDMVTLVKGDDINYDMIRVDEEWNDSKNCEFKMHTIHTYPAKFPAFIATKAFEYAKEEGIEIGKVADIFCGCGTVALESKIHNYDFWGCDINPVATMIAKAKSCDYSVEKIEKYYQDIRHTLRLLTFKKNEYRDANERLKYWHTEQSYLDLLKIYQAIELNVHDAKYRNAFECIFSSILKACSKWLTKSIKPQIDPKKKEINVEAYFIKQYKKFLNAVEELEPSNSTVEVKRRNFLTCKKLPKVDLLITSPPYVTSYEYADLHQLSSLWLHYTDDYRNLRRGSIGSTYYNNESCINMSNLNHTGKEIVDLLMKVSCPQVKVRSVARYYLDMQKAVKKSSLMLNNHGMAFFVIGDTEYKGVKILNSKHLIEALYEARFTDIKIGKRTISKGICVPFRDDCGKFSKDKNKKRIYHEEFIISGRYHE